jgi:hypothetical protein
MYIGLNVKCLSVLSALPTCQNYISPTDFVNTTSTYPSPSQSKIKYFIKIHQEKAEFFHEDAQADMCTDTIKL